MAGLLTAAETTAITATVSGSLDQSLPLSRNTTLGTSDTNGRPVVTITSVGNVACTVGKASASVLQEYAGVIGSKRALTLRAMQTTDIRQGDFVTYDSRTWTVAEVLNSASYSVTKTYLITTVA